MFPGSCLQCFMWHSTRRAPAYGKPRAARLRLSDSGVVAGPTLVCFIGLQSAWRWHQFRRHAGGKRATEGAGGGGGGWSCGELGHERQKLDRQPKPSNSKPQTLQFRNPGRGRTNETCKKKPWRLVRPWFRMPARSKWCSASRRAWSAWPGFRGFCLT